MAAFWPKSWRILEYLEAPRTPAGKQPGIPQALSCCVRPLGPHAADARQGMLARRRSGRVSLAEEAKLVCGWTLCPT